MSVMTDRLVMDYSNGRPSVYLSLLDGTPALHWMILGQNEPFDVWLNVELSGEEAEKFAQNPPARLDSFVSRLNGRHVKFTFFTDSVQLASNNWVIDPGENTLSRGLRSLQQMIGDIVSAGGHDARIAREAQVGLQPLVA